MRCDKVKELLLTDYADGEAGASATKAVKEHLESCHECRQTEKAVLAAKNAFHSLKLAEAPPYLWQRIKKAINTGEAKRPVLPVNMLGTLKDLLFGPRYIFARATAIALVILIIVFAGFAAQKHYMAQQMSYQDIVGMTSFDINGEDTSSGMGTAAEEYLL